MRLPGRRRRALGLALASILVTTALVVPASLAYAAAACRVDYAKSWDNGSGFGANITIRNLGDPLSNWTLTYTWPGTQRVTNGWSANWSQAGAAVTATNMPWNGGLGANASVSIGFNGSYTGANVDPTHFSVNGTLCTGQPASPQLVVAPTAVSVPEGGTATYTVRLSAQPAGSVTVTSTAGTGDTDITIRSGAQLTFTTTNWDVNQTVTLGAAVDADVSNGTRAINVALAGAPTVVVQATELEVVIDPPFPIVTPTQVFVPEGGSATVTVRLSSAPPASNITIVVTAGSGDPDLTICSGGVITITPANWTVAQTIRICAAEDADSVNGTRTFILSSPGLSSVAITATEIDNDPPVPAKVDNPYLNAAGYRNASWQALVTNEAASNPGTLGNQMLTVAQQPTAVWLDRIAAVSGGGLAAHLNAALEQDAANGATPTVVTFVLHDLPNRRCWTPGSGELTVAGNGLTRYRSEFIDPIRQIVGQPQYANLRVAFVVEPDSMFTNIIFQQSRPVSTLRCIEAQQSLVYRDGIRYAINQLSPLANTYLYVDAAASNWLGWTDNFNAALSLYDALLLPAQGGPGYDKIHGFATNVAGFVPTEEIFLPDPFAAPFGTQLWISRFFDFNPRFDERDYATDLLTAFVSRGCTACAMVIDTSRSGWGGPARPGGVSSSPDLNRYVDESRLDRRPHRVSWCNQVGAGLGARPTGNTGIAGVDAFLWIKPPGESDGVSVPNIIDEDDPFEVYDPMCDPLLRNRFADTVPTNAMAGAPHQGRWFPAYFADLVRNAHPAF